MVQVDLMDRMRWMDLWLGYSAPYIANNSTDLFERFAVWWNPQPLHRLGDGELKGMKKTTVYCDKVCPVVDRHKWIGVGCTKSLLFPRCEL